MLIEIAIADAYAAGHEYTKPSPDRPNTVEHYVQHPTHLKLKPGMYTDDTQMTIAVANCLLDDKLTKLDFATAFTTQFNDDQRDGYARGFQKFLESTKTGQDFLDNIKPVSEKSGGAMRAGVIGLLPTLKDVLEISKLQASLTHNTTHGIAAAQAAAFMVYHQVNKIGPKKDLPAFLSEFVPDILWIPNRARTGQSGEEITRTALAVLLDSNTLSDILKNSVNIGGDTDTVAAIAMAVASVSTEFERDLPNTLVYTLENRKYGRDYLLALDQQLALKFSHDIVKIGPRIE